MRYCSTDSITLLNLCSELCGRWHVLHSLSFTASKGEYFNIFSAKDIVHVNEEPDYHPGIAGAALLEFKLDNFFSFTALHERTLVTTRHPSNIKLTPKSQHDILTVIHCYSLCQGSAHLNSWLMQELDTHPFAGTQPPHGPCLHSSLSGEFLPLHPSILQVFLLFVERRILHLFPPGMQDSPSKSSSHVKYS